MLEIEVATECNHIFVIHIDSVLTAPQKGAEIVCGVCREKTKIRTVGTPGRIREQKPKSSSQQDMFKE